MLASASSAFGNLQALRLVLSLAARDKGLIPEPLMEQVRLVVDQAVKIAGDPACVNAETRPEAISLAYAMHSNSKLRAAIDELKTLQSIDESVADATLQLLDAAFVI